MAPYDRDSGTAITTRFRLAMGPIQRNTTNPIHLITLHLFPPRDARVHHQPSFSFPEVHDMIELDPRRWGYKERMEGREEGLEEGLELGREEGFEIGLQLGLKQAQLTILLRLLESKFGPLSSDWQHRIQAASEEQREQWIVQLLHVQSLDDLCS